MEFEAEWNWIAGFIEGEGCFTAPLNQTGTPSSRVQATSTDKDCVEKLQRLLGGSLYGPRLTSKISKKPSWTWAVHGKDARCLMMKLYPMMSIRRKARIAEIMTQWHQR